VSTGSTGGKGGNSSTGNTVLTNLWNHLWRRRVGFVQLYFSRQQKRSMRQCQEVALLEIISVAQIVGSGGQRVAVGCGEDDCSEADEVDMTRLVG
jgi:hypothetical protein